jgi:hypothetical protein
MLTLFGQLKYLITGIWAAEEEFILMNTISLAVSYFCGIRRLDLCSTTIFSSRCWIPDMGEGYRLYNSRLVDVPELVHRPLRFWAADKTLRGELVLVLDTRSKTLGPIERAAGFLKPDIDARKRYEARRAPSPAASRDCGITNLVKKIPFYFSSARVREGELLQQPH